MDRSARHLPLWIRRAQVGSLEANGGLASNSSTKVLGGIAGLAVLIGICGRIAVFPGQPLWFDETFTGVIANQPDLAHLYRWTVMELGGPVYYLLSWLWQLVAGPSNAALRVPSLLASFCALAIVSRTRVLPEPSKLILLSLLALHYSAYLYSAEARSYALVILFGLLQAFSFIELLRDTTTRRATLWVGVSGIAILTHYHAGVVSLMQGLIYLAMRRTTALRTWPALFALLPMAVWGAIQFDFLASYAKPGANWYSLIEPGSIIATLPLAIPFGGMAYVLCAFALYPVLNHALSTARGIRAPDEELLGDTAVTATALSGILAVALIVCLGMIVPSFAPRYLLPATPALMIGIAAGLARLHRTMSAVVNATLVLIVFASASFCYMLARHDGPLHPLNFEPASEWIMANGAPQRVVFFWDNPTSGLGPASHLAEVGGFFFQRAGRKIETVVLTNNGQDSDPNPALRKLAGTDEKGAIIWIVDKAVPGTLAIHHEETLRKDPAWRCQKRGDKKLYVLACLPRH